MLASAEKQSASATTIAFRACLHVLDIAPPDERLVSGGRKKERAESRRLRRSGRSLREPNRAHDAAAEAQPGGLGLPIGSSAMSIARRAAARALPATTRLFREGS